MLSESQVFAKLQECLKQAEGCCRQLAHLRGDIGWLELAQGYAIHQEKILKLATTRGGISTLHRGPYVRRVH